MSHEVETMAWTNEVPWHGLGVQVSNSMTTEQMMKAAGLDWTVSKRDMQLTTGESVPGFYALTRDSDNSILDVCGKEYTPVQNADAFEFFREFVEAGNATMETAGSLKGGRMVWVLANLGKKAAFKLAGGDEVKCYLNMAQPHQQGKAQVIQFTNVRVVCNNTLTMALNEVRDPKTGRVHKSKEGSHYRRAHRGQFDDAAQERAKQALGIARDQAGEFAEFALKLSKTKVDRDHAAALLAEIFGEGELAALTSYELIAKDAGKATAAALQALDKAPGALLPSAKGTAWGVLNAVTYTTDHLLRRSNDSRLFNAWYGKSRNIKTKAMEVLAG